MSFTKREAVVLSKNKHNDQINDDPILADYLRRFGTSASVGMLHPKLEIFSDASIDGIINYRLEHNCAVALGDPLCYPQNKIPLAAAFNDFCKQHNNKSIYLMTTEAFNNEALAAFGGSALLAAHEVIIDPTIDVPSLTGHYASHLRQKRRNALAHGITAHEYKETDSKKEEIFTNIAKTWLSNRKGLQAFFQPLDVFAHRSHKRWFYAEKNSQPIALLMMSKIPACDGWLVNNGIMLTPEAPASTNEFLVLYVLETLRNEGCTYFTNGPTPCEIERIEGFNWLSQIIATHGVKTVLKILRLNDRQRFWNKFQPRREPCFVTFTSRHISLRQALALLKIVNIGVKH